MCLLKSYKWAITTNIHDLKADWSTCIQFKHSVKSSSKTNCFHQGKCADKCTDQKRKLRVRQAHQNCAPESRIKQKHEWGPVRGFPRPVPRPVLRRNVFQIFWWSLYHGRFFNTSQVVHCHFISLHMSLFQCLVARLNFNLTGPRDGSFQRNNQACVRKPHHQGADIINDIS